MSTGFVLRTYKYFFKEKTGFVLRRQTRSIHEHKQHWFIEQKAKYMNKR